MDEKSLNCRKCKYFYITWDKVLPYGCRLHQMKTHLIPSQLVKRASGHDCLGFELKKRLAEKESDST